MKESKLTAKALKKKVEAIQAALEEKIEELENLVDEFDDIELAAISDDVIRGLRDIVTEDETPNGLPDLIQYIQTDLIEIEKE